MAAARHPPGGRHAARTRPDEQVNVDGGRWGGMERTWQPGFETRREELRKSGSTSRGFPEWLDGALVSNGPGQFEVGETTLDHWFDALAMLRQFRIADGGVRYTNRFVRSEDFRVARDEQRVRRALPGTPADASVPARLHRALTGRSGTTPRSACWNVTATATPSPRVRSASRSTRRASR